MDTNDQAERWLMPSDVAGMLHVTAKTIARYTADGTIPASAYVRTIGGHRRYRASAIEALFTASQEVETA